MKHLSKLSPFLLLAVSAWAAEPAASAPSFYYDETTARHLVLKPGEFGSTLVEVRFAYEAGSANRWFGIGQRKDKTLVFTRVAGEGEDRGTVFAANVSESKVEITYRPGQKEPQDAGINGIYRRASDAKRMQLAKKEFEAAGDRLANSLKAAAKARSGKEKDAMSRWREQWPVMRQRCLNISYKVSPGLLGGLEPVAATNPEAVKDPDYWFKQAEITTRGSYFVESVPDPRTGTGWDGEYDDFSGGHVSLRLQKDGRLRMSIYFYRAEEVINEGTEAVAPVDKIITGKDGEMTAEMVYQPVAEEGSPPKSPVHFRLIKLGRYLEVKTDGADKLAGRGWFDGIYRGGPVPELN
jgi:hypothetical protein